MERHPGVVLLEEFLVPLGISRSDLARGLGVDRSAVTRLVRGEHAITPSMAARLGAYFGIPARWWLRMQADYDAAVVDGAPGLVAGVSPWEGNPDVLLTPSGVLRLDAADDRASPSGVRQVVFDNGAVALLSGDS